PSATTQAFNVRIERPGCEPTRVVTVLGERDTSHHEMTDLSADRSHADVRPVDRHGLAAAIEEVLAECVQVTQRVRSREQASEDFAAINPVAAEPIAGIGLEAGPNVRVFPDRVVVEDDLRP